MSPIPSPGVLNSVTDKGNKRSSLIFGDMQSSGSSAKKSKDDIHKEMQTRAMTIYSKDDDSRGSRAVGDDEDDDDSKSELNTTSPSSSTTSAKENSVPKKKAGRKSTTNRNLMMTYSPKKRKRPSSSRSSSTANKLAEPEEKKRRGRPSSSSTINSNVNETKSTVSDTVSEKSSRISSDKEFTGRVPSRCGSTVSDQISERSSTSSRTSRRSSRFTRDKGSDILETISNASEILVERGRSEEVAGDDDTGCGSSIVSESNSVRSTRSGSRNNERNHEREGKKDLEGIVEECTEVSKKEEQDEVEGRRSKGERAEGGGRKNKDKNKRDRKEKGDSDRESDSDSSDSESEEEDDSSDEENAGKSVYVVERIDDKKIVEGVTYYFIKWKGWHESSNTWEPLKNLDGCTELLEEFEKRYAEKKNRRRGGGGARNRRMYSEEVDEAKLVDNTQSHMRSYGILPEWPADKEPISVEGVIHVDGVLTYVVKRRARLGSNKLDRSNAILVYADSFRQYYPELVIRFYESRVLWTENAKDDEDQASVAAQIALLVQNSGSILGRDIANDMDKQLREAYKDNEKVLQDMEMETQIIDLSGDGQQQNDEAMEEDTQEVGSGDNDNFGLPEDMEDTDISSCLSDDTELEEVVKLKKKRDGSDDEVDVY